MWKLCCRLVEGGHSGAADYGFGFFIDALNEHEQIKLERLAFTAYAVRVGTNADKDGWRKFLRSCGIKTKGKPATMMPMAREQLQRQKHGNKRP